MKEITVLSGKGGTGKTCVSAALASFAEKSVFVDSDVDAADLHLIFNPTVKEKHKFLGRWQCKINENQCTNCGLCVRNCQFDAIHYKQTGGLIIDPYSCEGCRLCERLCPARAIETFQNSNNHWFVSESRFGVFVHAKMGPGEDNSGKLVTQVRTKAKEIARENESDFIISDGPPGIGCATIASITGSDKIVLVAEPSKSGFHDVVRLIELVQFFNIPMYALINKYDINVEISNQMERFFESQSIKLVGKIPFDEEMVHAVVEGKTIVEKNRYSPITSIIGDLWKELKA